MEAQRLSGVSPPQSGSQRNAPGSEPNGTTLVEEPVVPPEEEWTLVDRGGCASSLSLPPTPEEGVSEAGSTDSERLESDGLGARPSSQPDGASHWDAQVDGAERSSSEENGGTCARSASQGHTEDGEPPLELPLPPELLASMYMPTTASLDPPPLVGVEGPEEGEELAGEEAYEDSTSESLSPQPDSPEPASDLGALIAEATSAGASEEGSEGTPSDSGSLSETEPSAAGFNLKPCG